VFGGRLAPIVKNRSFFFMNYEGRRDASSQNATRTGSTDELRQESSATDSARNVRTLTPADIRTQVDPLGIGPNPAALDLFNKYPGQ
jgi:hypothetical protein